MNTTGFRAVITYSDGSKFISETFDNSYAAFKVAALFWLGRGVVSIKTEQVIKQG